MIIDKYGAVYPDRLTELNVTGLYVTMSDGSVPCGLTQPSTSTYVERVSLRKFWNLSTNECQRIQATGDSMIDVGICDGDILVVDPHQMPQSGSPVVAFYKGELTVKTLYMNAEEGKLYLMPANRDFAPICIDEPDKLDIVGVVSMISRTPARRCSDELHTYLEHDQQEERLGTMMQHTIDAGYMTEMGDWSDKASDEFIATWIDAVCYELGIANKWRWAENRWGLRNLKQCLNRLKESRRWEAIDKEVSALIV